MKKMMFLALMMVMTVTANAMSYQVAKNEALFLSDKMAYELNLTAAQYEAVYEINLDYLMSLNGHADVFGIWWDRRNADLRYVLTAWQYDKYMSLAYFYRPVTWKSGGWTFGVYSHYSKKRFFNDHPKVFVTYKGGNNHKHDRFYADRNVTKPKVNHNTQTAHGNKPASHNDNQTWRDKGNGNANNGHANVNNSHGNANSNSHANVNNSRGHGAGNSSSYNRQIAQNTNNNRSASGHFGGSR